jgi:sugar lactone lactonase YvrE
MLLIVLVVGCCSINAQTITSVAGNGITQYIGDGSPATNFSLAGPDGIFADKKGNIYIADYFNSRIRKLSHDTLSTVAGTGLPGYTGDGGAAGAAQIGNPDGIFRDTAGNWYITDEHNDVVRKINAHTGFISTVCGSGSGGFGGDGAAATTANMELPGGACVDVAGNIYIPDYGNQRIRKVSAATGIIATIAGTGTSGYSGDNGPATNARVSYPNSICLDSAGNIYFSERGNNVIRKINAATGTISTVAGSNVQGYSGDGASAVSAELSEPNSVFVDKAGYMYISDYGNNVIRAVTPAGIIHTIAGTGAAGYTGDGGPATAATFRGLTAVFVDDTGYIFVADGDNSVIRKITPLVPFRDEIKEIKVPVCNIFPNPSAGRFTITANEANNVTIEICNTIGQSIYRSQFIGNKMDIDLMGYPRGMYLLQYISPDEKAVYKLIIR